MPRGIYGSEGCAISHEGIDIGVTPCVVSPPFSVNAFTRGAYRVRVGRPGANGTYRDIPNRTGRYRIRMGGDAEAPRPGGAPDGDTLVVGGGRRVVVSDDMVYLVDHAGGVIFRVGGAYFTRRLLGGVVLHWEHHKLGKLTYVIRVDGLKAQRLCEMTSALKPKPEAAKKSPRERSRKAPKKQPGKPGWFRRFGFGGGKKKKINGGTYNGVDLRVTKNDLNTKLWRFDPTHFECITANLFASMGYKIEKGYDAKTNRMRGPTVGDKGVDVLAVRDKERVVVQCKKFSGQCGSPEVNKTIGAANLGEFRGTHVWMVCTGGFSRDAYAVAESSTTPVKLLDWPEMRRLIRRHMIS